MAKLIPAARSQLSTPTARDATRQKRAELVQEELDAEKRELEEGTAELRAKRLALAHDLPRRQDDTPAE
jgi:hypothetical protein